MKIGIIREEKIPHDKRVPFTPEQAKMLMEENEGLEIVVQPSPFRCYHDSEYQNAGIKLQEDLGSCDLLMGIKEVPPEKLLDGQSYMFFSHTIKRQEHNKPLLRALLEKQIRMIDYECLVDEEGRRVIGFGRYAGIVGAYNGLMGYGRKYGLFTLEPADILNSKEKMFEGLRKTGLPNIKIIITGGGRVANGAEETMGVMNIRKVTPYEFLNYSFREPVYVQLHSHDYYAHKEGKPFSRHEFYESPGNFESHFGEFTKVCDLLIHCAYWDPRAPRLFSIKEMKDPRFRISVIADVTCDINGSIPSTVRSTTIEDKFYGYNPQTEEIMTPFLSGNITVMAIDNLPCELPRDASEGFGKHLMERVIPEVVNGDRSGLLKRATICDKGRLMNDFLYLSEYAGVQ
jgi:alanine dehydrogenase